jgi:cation diffusion facilitator family transporter
VEATRLKRAAKLSLLLSGALALLKLVAGFASGSAGLLGDGVHSAFDAFSSTVVYLGVRFSERPPDKRHPYGYYQAETLAGLFVTTALILAGAGVAWEALGSLMTRAVPEAVSVLLAIVLVSALLSEAMARYKFRVGGEANSIALLADAYHSRSDALSSGAVLIGLLLVSFGVFWGDAAAGIAVAGIILFTGARLGREAADVLMDKSPSDDVLQRIAEAAKSMPMVKGCRVTRSRAAGGHIFAEMEVDVDGELSIESGNQVVKGVEQRVKAAVPGVESTVVSLRPLGLEARRVWAPRPWSRGHGLGRGRGRQRPPPIEPPWKMASGKRTIAVPITGGSLEDPLDSHFGRCAAFAVVEVEGRKVEGVRIVENPHRSLEYGSGRETARLVIEAGADVVIADHLGEGSAASLREAKVEIIIGVPPMKAKEAVEKYLRGELKQPDEGER